MHILMPTDGSELSVRASNRGLEFAKALNGKVTCLFVNKNIYISALDGAATHIEDDGRIKAEFARIQQQAAELGVACDCVLVTNGSPKDEIIRVATDMKCDLIIMGTKGRSKVGKFFLGSVAASVLADCDIPVMLYR